MKKYILGLMAPMVFIVSNSQAYFVVGSTHKSKKSDQAVMLLGDMHVQNWQADTQRSNLVTGLKKIKPEDLLILVEDMASAISPSSIKNNYKKLMLAPIPADTMRRLTPLSYLYDDYKKSLPIKNVENRTYSSLVLINPYLVTNQSFEQSLVDELKSNYTPINTFKESLKSQQKKQELEALKILRTNNIKLVKLTIIKNYRNLKQSKSLQDLKDYIRRSVYDIKILFKDCCSMLDLDFACTILKNPNKKNIVICAGAAHTSQLQKFLSKLDYSKTSTTGHDVDWTNESLVYNAMINNPTPIDTQVPFAQATT